MRVLAVASLLALAALPVHALYKIVGPDGKVTYTDRPPQAGEGRAVPLNRDASAASSDVAMPIVLREAMNRFPVTLYTTSECQPCEAARALLRQRGVPYRERTATGSVADQQAWQKATGGTDAPSLTIGSQALRGFSPDAWHSYLDTAGYPRESRLPANYTAPPPAPLVETPAAVPAAAPRPPAPRQAEPPPAPASGSFRF